MFRKRSSGDNSPMKWPSLNDLMVIAGLGTMTYGLWLYKPWVSLTVLGVTLICMGVYPYVMIKKD